MTFCMNAEGEIEASTTTFPNNISSAAAVNAAPPNNSIASSHNDTTIAFLMWIPKIIVNAPAKKFHSRSHFFRRSLSFFRLPSLHYAKSFVPPKLTFFFISFIFFLNLVSLSSLSSITATPVSSSVSFLAQLIHSENQLRVHGEASLLHADLELLDFEGLLLWVEQDLGPWGPLVLFGGCYLFGLPVGFVADSIGATVGAGAAFLLGGTIGRSFVVSRLKDYAQFRAVAIAIRRSGFKTLNPLYLPGSRITSSHFDTKGRALAQKYL